MGINLFFAGDVVLSNHISASLISEELENIIGKHDIACCNFEAPIFYSSQKAESKLGPTLYQNESTLNQLCLSGFNLFALANNHIMDYGIDGVDYTVEQIKKHSCFYIGAGHEEKFKPYEFIKDDLKIAIFNVAEFGFGTSLQDCIPGYAWFGAETFKAELKKAIKEYDHIIVVCHGGAEKWDVPLPEYRELYKSWIDLGVSVVIGHHPHVPQGWEEYKEGIIFYSLGNFAFDKGRGIQDSKTICASVSVEKSFVTYNVVYTEFTQEGVKVCNDEAFHNSIRKKNELLNSEEYISEINSKVMSCFDSQYIDYYEHILNQYKGNIKQILKTLYFRVLKREKFSDLWLYHNISIETHVWICRRAADLRRNGYIK